MRWSTSPRLARGGLLLLLALAFAAPQRSAAVDIQPTSHVLVPYFEVVLDPNCRTTRVAVANVAARPVAVTATVHSNWGIPLLSVPYRIPASGVWRFDLRDWLLDGRLPTRRLPAADVAHLQAALVGRPSPRTGLYYGTDKTTGEHPMAVGYVTVTARGKQPPDVLWGDYLIYCPQTFVLQGETLVDIDPFDAGATLCTGHALRFREPKGLVTATEVMVWTPVRLEASPTPEPAATVHTTLLWYDDAGLLFRRDELELLPSELLDYPEGTVEREFGWIAILSESPSFVTGHYSQENDLGSSLHAWCTARTGAPPARPGIALRKEVQGDAADTPTGPVVPVGATLDWTFEVANVGSSDLHDVVVDDSGLLVTCPGAARAVGGSMTCTATSVALACQQRNVARVTALTPDDREVDATDRAHYFGDPGASIALETRVQGQDADTPTGPSIAAGAAVTLAYEVLADGEAPLSAVAVTDSQGVAVSCPRSSLAAGESMTCTAATTAKSGQQVHTGSVTADAPCEATVNATDPAYYNGEVPAAPAIHLEKYVNDEDADTPPGPSFAAGSPLAWKYAVTNTGNVTLGHVTVTDDRGVVVTCPQATLAVGAAMTCTGASTAVAGPYANIGTATGTPPQGPAVSDDDPCHYTGTVPPGPDGCSPGYWKNHTESWPPTGYSPGQNVASVFPAASSFPALASSTLLAALSFHGGPGEDGAAQSLLRAAVAALLNAAHPGVDYPRTPTAVVAEVNTALLGTRDDMLALASALDRDDNLGCALD